MKKSEIHVFSFDLSLNEATQTCEMDVYIRFWDSLENEVKVRYIGSTFFGHGTHQNLVKNFHDIDGLDEAKNYQVPMDGPNVNLKFLKSLRQVEKQQSITSWLILVYAVCMQFMVPLKLERRKVISSYPK